jgi:hypothetical protein
MSWSEQAAHTIDVFMSAVFQRYILPTFPLQQKVYAPEYDEVGFPQMRDGKWVGKHVTIEEYLARGGITFEESPTDHGL